MTQSGMHCLGERLRGSFSGYDFGPGLLGDPHLGPRFGPPFSGPGGGRLRRGIRLATP